MPKRKSLKDKALNWIPEKGDIYGNDKMLFLKYITENCLGVSNAKSIKSIINSVPFSISYSENVFQHYIIVPLREVGSFFIGTGSKGIYFIETATDAYKTIEFYTTRIRSEKKHLRTLKTIAKKNKLFKNFSAPMPLNLQRNLYFDESGRPSLDNLVNDPYFIVTAIIIDGKKPISTIDKKFAFIKELLGKPQEYEFKANQLKGKPKHYITVLKELSTIDYEFASVCFIKKDLTSEGFKYPKSFYKYAFSFLIDNVLNYTGAVNLYFDVYSNKNSKFETEFLNYIKKSALGFPFNKVDQTDMLSSTDHPLIQMADLLTGVVRDIIEGKGTLFKYVEDKAIDIYYFPYKKENGV